MFKVKVQYYTTSGFAVNQHSDHTYKVTNELFRDSMAEFLARLEEYELIARITVSKLDTKKHSYRVVSTFWAGCCMHYCINGYGVYHAIRYKYNRILGLTGKPRPRYTFRMTDKVLNSYRQ